MTHLLSRVIMDTKPMKRCAYGWMGLLVCGLLSGCQSQWAPEPEFGSSVNQAVSAQFANPGAPATNAIPKAGMDGAAAKSTMDNYQNSFKNPRHGGTTSVTGTIQGGGATSGAGGTAVPTLSK